MINVADYDALLDSMMKCKCGVLWKDSAAHFYLNSAEEVYKLCKELKDGTYKERPQKKFTITSPKEREVVSISFRDRVYQRSLNDNVIYPQMSKSLIYDNCACQKNKGTDFARNRLKMHMQKMYRKHGNKYYVLKMDIRHYYQTMQHDIAKKCFAKHIDQQHYDMAKQVLDSYEGEIGYNPGSQMIQITGISVLNDIDHFIKERLHVKHYMRYMDDMIILSNDINELKNIKYRVANELKKIGFELHRNKTKIYSAVDGFMFLGFKFRITKTGRVIMTVDPTRVKAERKKLYRLVKLAKQGKRTHAKVDACYESWKNHAAKGNSYKLLQRMDAYYQSLWSDENDTGRTQNEKNSAVNFGTV